MPSPCLSDGPSKCKMVEMKWHQRLGSKVGACWPHQCNWSQRVAAQTWKGGGGLIIVKLQQLETLQLPFKTFKGMRPRSMMHAMCFST